MASVCGNGPIGMVCRAAEHLQLPGGESAGQITRLAKTGVGSAAGSVAGSVLSQIAQAMASAADGLFKTLSSFWMNVDTPQLDTPGSPVAAIQSDTRWIVAVTAVACILVTAARMAIRHRGEPAATMLLGLARLVIVSAIATLTVEAAGKLGDTFSQNLMNSAHLGTSGWSGIISTATLSSAFAAGDGMMLIIALLIIFSALIQLMLMILRIGLLMRAHCPGDQPDRQRQVAAQPGNLSDRRSVSIAAGPGGQPGQQPGRISRGQRAKADRCGLLQRGQPAAAGDQHHTGRAARQQRPDLLVAAGVVEHQQHFLVGHDAAPQHGPRIHPAGDAAGGDPGGEQQGPQGRARVGGLLSRGVGVQGEEELPVREPRGQHVSSVHGEGRLADPGHPVHR